MQRFSVGPIINAPFEVTVARYGTYAYAYKQTGCLQPLPVCILPLLPALSSCLSCYYAERTSEKNGRRFRLLLEAILNLFTFVKFCRSLHFPEEVDLTAPAGSPKDRASRKKTIRTVSGPVGTIWAFGRQIQGFLARDYSAVVMGLHKFFLFFRSLIVFLSPFHIHLVLHLINFLLRALFFY